MKLPTDYLKTLSGKDNLGSVVEKKEALGDQQMKSEGQGLRVYQMQIDGGSYDV